MIDDNSNIQKLYDKLIKLCEYPGENEPSPRGLLFWHDSMDSFYYGIMKVFANSDIVERINNINEIWHDLLNKYNKPPYNEYEFLGKGYGLSFTYLGSIAEIFVYNGLMESMEGKNIIQELINEIDNYVKTNVIDNNTSIWYYECHLNALNSLLISFGNRDYLNDYKIIREALDEYNNMPFYEEYKIIELKKDLFKQYFGMMVKFVNEWDPNIMIPLNLTKSD